METMEQQRLFDQSAGAAARDAGNIRQKSLIVQTAIGIIKAGQTGASTPADPNQINLNRRSNMANQSLPKNLSIDNLEFAAFPPKGPFIDLTGMRYGFLTVLGFKGRHRLHSFWWCRCDCGTVLPIRSNTLRVRAAKSCGCWSRSLIGDRSRKHGRYGTPEYRIWRNMLTRCENPNNHKYPRYGGRGISVCDRWKVFADFFADMGERPSPNHSIDRIDNAGNYEPSNCHWATPKEQSNNRRDNVRANLWGKTQTVSQWCQELGLCRGRVDRRRKKGMSVEVAIVEALKSTAVYRGVK